MSTTLTTVCQMAVAIEVASAKWVVASTAGGERTIRRKVLSQEQAEERFAALLAELAEARRKLGVAEDARVVVGYEAGHEGLVKGLDFHELIEGRALARRMGKRPRCSAGRDPPY